MGKKKIKRILKDPQIAQVLKEKERNKDWDRIQEQASERENQTLLLQSIEDPGNQTFNEESLSSIKKSFFIKGDVEEAIRQIDKWIENYRRFYNDIIDYYKSWLYLRWDAFRNAKLRFNKIQLWNAIPYFLAKADCMKTLHLDEEGIEQLGSVYIEWIGWTITSESTDKKYYHELLEGYIETLENYLDFLMKGDKTESAKVCLKNIQIIYNEIKYRKKNVVLYHIWLVKNMLKY